MITCEQHYRNTLDAIRRFEAALARVDGFTADLDPLARQCFVDAYAGELAELRALAADYETRLSTAPPASGRDRS
jgi:hypothetical protein